MSREEIERIEASGEIDCAFDAYMDEMDRQDRISRWLAPLSSALATAVLVYILGWI